MGILVDSKKLVGGMVGDNKISKIYYGTNLVWQNSSAEIVYDGKSYLEGKYVGKEFLGYIEFYSASGFIDPSSIGYISGKTYADIVAPTIHNYVNADPTSFYWCVGVTSIPIDFTKWKRVVVTYEETENVTLGRVTQKPLCQIADQYYDNDIEGGTVIPESARPQEIQIDVSAVSGIKYLRFVGYSYISKIILDNKGVST